MATLKKIGIWILLLIIFFVFSNFLIAVGLNSNYKDMKRNDNNEKIIIYQADATFVNGRIRGIIQDAKTIEDNYLKVELYTKRNVLVGKKYIPINHDEEGNQPFELLFRAKEADNYKIETVKEKEPGEELEILPKEWTKPEILLATAITFLIFWG